MFVHAVGHVYTRKGATTRYGCYVTFLKNTHEVHRGLFLTDSRLMLAILHGCKPHRINVIDTCMWIPFLPGSV